MHRPVPQPPPVSLPVSPPVTPISQNSLNLLQFDCEFPEEEGHPAESLTVLLPAQCSVYQLRLRICISLQSQERGSFPEPHNVLDPEKSSLLYQREDQWYETYDDGQVLRTLHIPWRPGQDGIMCARVLVKKVVALDSEQRRSQQKLLSYLIGHDVEAEARERLDELTFTRRKLASSRRQALAGRDPELYATEPWVTQSPLTAEMTALLTRMLMVNVHYSGEFSFMVKMKYSDTPETLLKTCRTVLVERGFSPSEPLLLKVSGREEFLSGPHPFSSFLWVRQCMKTHLDLHLSLLPRSCLPPDSLDHMDWPLVDSFSGQFSSHDDLRLDRTDVDHICLISLWDCNRKLRVKLLGFDVPQLPEKLQGKSPPLVYVEASILYGSKVWASVCSAAKPMAEEVLWNEWLEFDMLLSDLPRGAKLGLTINTTANDSSKQEVKSASIKENKAAAGKDNKMAAGGKEGRRSSVPLPVLVPKTESLKENMLYFVNLLLIDHRSVLVQGSHTLFMWSGQTQTQDAVTFHADKLSSASNPDQNQAVAITVTFDRYSYPVVLPNATRTHDHRATQVSSAPPSAAASPKLPQTRSDLGHFQKESVHYESNLPQYLRQVDWMKRQSVEDVHWLLGQWGAPEQLDLAVALELLSLDFIDHRVRRLAVDRLWHLSNEELLRYLLQLVQTLKVETYHDSFLARFLIQRALQSKRIGHFLFWYMRSEVLGCLFFRQRMAVILEAYLLGCGRDMTQRLQLQVQAVEALQTVALSLDQLLQKRDVEPQAPQWLRDLLEKCDLPPEFVLPFDPRVKVGRILLSRCKVMASKKKPMWLEFEPSPSPLSSESVGVIFKYGDDLRQDMLVIQTFVLMDSIWQDKSLDLNLVPYGCIATGYNIGMIQTVRNAVTMAAIQRSFGGSAGAFKEDALFEWLKSKCPLQEMHFQTVEAFVRSCAGYCVASYVLGIGDRHNDNIMVTESGNLFHIDFGHILGNWKRFLGQNRERVPFVLTPDFLYVMGRVKPRTSLYFERFKDLCLEAYLSLRSRSHLLVTLFSIMVLTGIRELSEASDMRYLREVLQEGRSQEHARSHFLEQIDVCEADGWKVQTNWWFHMVAGSKG